MNRVAVVTLIAVAVSAGLAGAQEPPDQEQGRVVSYDEAQALVIQNSFELKLADEDIRDAQRRLKRARRQYHPRIRAQATARGDLLTIDEWNDEQNLGAGLVLDWAPYRNGELLRENAASKIGLTVATLGRRQTAMDLDHEFRRLYYDILNAMDEVELKKLERKLEERKLAAIEADVEQGRATKGDALTQKGTFFKSDAAWIKSGQTLQIKLIELEERMGVDGVAGVDEADRTIGPLDEMTAEDCIAAAQTTRIVLIGSREKVRLADLGVKYANLKRLPSVYFYTETDFALTQELGGEDFELRAGVTVSYPLYGAGDTGAAIADAKAGAVRARIQDSQTHMKVEREIREAYWAYVNAVRQLESTREREQVFEEDFREAQLDQESEAIGPLEFMEAEIRYHQSLRRTRQLELDVLMARATLTRAVGVSTLEGIQRGSSGQAPDEPGRKEAQ